VLKDRENILTALREKPLKTYQLMRRANLPNEEACQSLLLKMRDEGLVNSTSTRGIGTSHSQVHAAGLISPSFLFSTFHIKPERASRNRAAQLITAKSSKLNVGAQIRLKLTAQK